MLADLVIFNLRLPEASASSVAIADGKILRIGAETDVAALIGPQTQQLDGRGAVLLPGFVESHVHLFGGGVALQQLNLADVDRVATLTYVIRAFDAAYPGDHLLQAYAANYTILGDHRPSRHDLDRILPDRPLAITTTDLHCVWANTRALEAAGILHGAEVPSGSEVVMGPDGLATGELREFAAMALVLRLGLSGGREALGLSGIEPEAVSPAERAADKDALARAMAECARMGITRAVNMDGNLYQAALLTEMEAEGRLPIRVSLPLVLTAAHGPQDVARALKMGKGSDRLRFGRIKMFMDGVFDTWTAFVTDEYPDRPGFPGTPLFTAKTFDAICIEADRLGLQIAVHAVGDGAVRRVLNGYEAARAVNGPRDSRHRIEHIDTIHPKDLPRLAPLGVTASMQPVHPPGSAGLPLEPTISLMGRARWPMAFAWRKLRDAGVLLAFGTDWPVSPLDPLHAIHSALTRQPWANDMPDQRLDLAECLDAYTQAGLAADFAEGTGQIAPGMSADLVLLTGELDGLSGPQAQWPNVRATICAGAVIYDAESDKAPTA